MTVGERIKEQRRGYGLTQKQLAEKMGVAEITIRQYETGKRIPSLDMLQKIADALKISIRDVIPPTVVTKDDTFLTYEAIENSIRERHPELYDYENEPAYKALVRVDDAFTKLNDEGIEEAVKRVEELTEIPKYQRIDSPSERPQDTPEDKK